MFVRRFIKEAGEAPMAVIVMGVSGCGKSTIGAKLANALGCRFIEGDVLHDPAAVEKMRRGIALTDEDRWPWLDRIADAAGKAVASDGTIVVTCSALRRVYRDRLRTSIKAPTQFVFLDNSRDEILRRLTARAHEFMPTSLLDSQFATLEHPDPDENVVVLYSDASPDALCRMAAERLTAEAVAG